MVKILGKKVILIIEDDVNLQQVYLDALTQEGFVVLQALNGKQGLRMAKFEKPDLILLDIMLPSGMNGFDVLEELKRDLDTKKIPVTILTNLESEQKTAKDIGAQDYLIKANVSVGEIIEHVKKKLSFISL